MWRKKEMNAFGVIYSWFLAKVHVVHITVLLSYSNNFCDANIRMWVVMLLKVGEKLEVLPGSEFRVGYEQALACGAKVTLGDRPVHVSDACTALLFVYMMF